MFCFTIPLFRSFRNLIQFLCWEFNSRHFGGFTDYLPGISQWWLADNNLQPNSDKTDSDLVLTVIPQIRPLTGSASSSLQLRNVGAMFLQFDVFRLTAQTTGWNPLSMSMSKTELNTIIHAFCSLVVLVIVFFSLLYHLYHCGNLNVYVHFSVY